MANTPEYLANRPYTDLLPIAPELILQQDSASLWHWVFEAVSMELNLLNRVVDRKRYYFDIDSWTQDPSDPIFSRYGANYTFEDEIQAFINTMVSRMEDYGYPPNLALLSSTASLIEKANFLKTEYKTIWYKIKYKGTRMLYEYFYKLQNLRYEVQPILRYSTSDEGWRDGYCAPFYDWESTFKNVEAFDFKSLFTGHVYPDIQDIDWLYMQYDTDFYWDQERSSGMWRFDAYADLSPTSLILCEQVLDRLFTVEGREFLLPQSYLFYIENALAFSRKAAHVPLIGGMLTIPISTSDGLTTAWTSTGYAVPEIKLKASTTTAMYTELDGGKPTVYLDEDPARELDDAEDPQDMDQRLRVAQLASYETSFKRIALGRGTKNHYSVEALPLLQTDDMKFWFCADRASNLRDESGNLDPTEILPVIAPVTHTGTLEPVVGEVGKAFLFDKSWFQVSPTLPMTLSTTNAFTITFWLSGCTGDGVVLFLNAGADSPRLRIDYTNHASVNRKLVCTLVDGDTVSHAIDIPLPSAAASPAVCATLVFDLGATTPTITAYINGADSPYAAEVTGYVVLASSDIVEIFIGNDTTEDEGAAFKGKIENLRLYTKALSTSLIGLFYSQRVGSLLTLADEVYISDDFQGVETSLGSNSANGAALYAGTKICPALLVNNEVIPVENVTVDTATYTIKRLPVIKKSVRVFLVDTDAPASTFELRDDGLGRLVALDTALTAAGVNGTIDYVTGELVVYGLDHLAHALASADIAITYKTVTENMEITEAGLVNADGDVVAYATFPPIQLHSVMNHLRVCFLMEAKI